MKRRTPLGCDSFLSYQKVFRWPYVLCLIPSITIGLILFFLEIVSLFGSSGGLSYVKIKLSSSPPLLVPSVFLAALTGSIFFFLISMTRFFSIFSDFVLLSINMILVFYERLRYDKYCSIETEEIREKIKKYHEISDEFAFHGFFIPMFLTLTAYIYPACINWFPALENLESEKWTPFASAFVLAMLQIQPILHITFLGSFLLCGIFLTTLSIVENPHLLRFTHSVTSNPSLFAGFYRGFMAILPSESVRSKRVLKKQLVKFFKKERNNIVSQTLIFLSLSIKLLINVFAYERIKKVIFR